MANNKPSGIFMAAIMNLKSEVQQVEESMEARNSLDDCKRRSINKAQKFNF
jgi:hypothetical protein